MFSMTLICMGKLKEKFYISAAEEYKKRLGAFCSFQLLELPEYKLPEDPNPTQIAQGLSREAELIRKQAEEQALLSINDKKAIIATGGSAVFSTAGMAHLKENGICVYLRVDEQELIRRLTNIKTRGIACRPGETVAEIIAEREVYYNRYADITIDCLNTTAEQVVGMIMDRIK